MVDTHEADVREPPSVHESRLAARMGLFMVIAVAVLMALAAAVIFTHRPHTPQITPGQKQTPAVVSFLRTGWLS